MRFLKAFIKALTRKERLYLMSIITLVIVASVTRLTLAIEENSVFKPVSGGSYKEGVIGQPVALNPIISSNPVDQDLSELLYARLFNLLENNYVKENGKVYTLVLKENLKWDDGQPITSDDVVFTIQTIQDKESNSPLAKNWQGIIAERLSELQTQLTLPAPYAFLIENVKRLPLIPKHIFGAIPVSNMKLSSYNLEPVGNGPYRFKSFAKRKDGFISQYHLVVNENYEGQKPYIEDFYFKFYENERELFDAFQSRDINGFGSLTIFDASSYEEKNFAVLKIPMPRYYAIFFNSNINTALKDKNLRYALDEAIDKEKLVGEIFGNNASPVYGPILKTNGGESGGSTYDPEDAKNRFEKLKNPSLELNLIVPEIDFLEKTADMAKASWESVGIKTNVIKLNPENISDNIVKSRNYEMVLFGNIYENPEDLYPFWHSSQRFYPGVNLSLYQSTRADNLMETIRQSGDEEKRTASLETLEGVIIEDLPAVFLYSLPYTYVHAQNLKIADENLEKSFLATPQDRFKNVENWYVRSVRVVE